MSANRREVLAGLLAALSLGGCGTRPVCESPLDVLAAVLGPDVAPLGQAWVEEGGDASPERLVAELTDGGVPLSPEALQAAIAADFKEGRTELVGGWVLSLTECLLAALVWQAEGCG